MRSVMLVFLFACLAPSCHAASLRSTRVEPLALNSTAADMMKADAQAVVDSNRAFAAQWMTKAKDLPEYYECASVLNQAWELEGSKSCGAEMHRAAELMRSSVPKCQKLREGEAFVVSYGELLRAIDTWCKGPDCEMKCGDGEVCARQRAFPFAPSCTACSKNAHLGPACTGPNADCGAPPCDRFRDSFQLAVVADQAPSNSTSISDSNLAIAAQWLLNDNPHYYECAAAMNQAWKLEAKHSCGEDMHHAADLMKQKISVCKNLRQGEQYVRSYGELKRSMDRWCNGPTCDKACSDGEVCARAREFPFEPSCTKCSKDAYKGPACTAHDSNCGPPPCDKFRDTFNTKLVAEPVKPVAAVNTTHANTLKASAQALTDSNRALALQWVTKAKVLPEYYKCASVINQAWEIEASQPCGADMHRAAELMKSSVPTCGKLRQGKAFVVSYGELLRAIDTWCRGPTCEATCGSGEVCHRARDFPFSSACTKCSKDAYTGAACSHPDADCGPPPCDPFADTFATKPNAARR